jgi:serine/threonine-protein kinase
MAWTGNWPGTVRPLRVEAASLRGSPVAFSLIAPWTRAARMPPRESSSGQMGQFAILILVTLAVGVGTWLLVRRNAKKGAGDHEGAMRLARFVGFVQMGLWLFRTHLAMSIGTFGMFLIAMATAIFYAFVVRAMYIALEPYVRRRWPQTIISSTAVLSSHWRDPIVGRDVLIGTALAVILRVMLVGLSFPGADAPNVGSTDVLMGIRSTVAVCFKSIPHGIRETLVFFLIIFLLRVLLRNQWLAIAGFTLIFSALEYFQSSHPVIDGLVSLVVYGLVAFIVLRFGLLAMAVYIFVDELTRGVQATLHTSAWYLGNSVFLLACIVALAAWGFHTSIAGKRLWKQDLLA